MRTPFFRHLPRTGGLGLVTAMLAATLAFAAATPASASISPKYGSQSAVSAGGNTSAGPAATCNYRVYWRGGVNLHVKKDRSSKRVGHIKYNTTLVSQRCANSRGGKYASCGTGNLWKAVSWKGRSGWVATKCLQRV
jgi:hypothetical protein